MCCNPTSKARRKRNKEASHEQYALALSHFQKPNAAFILEKATKRQPIGHNELLVNPGFQTGYPKWAFSATQRSPVLKRKEPIRMREGKNPNPNYCLEWSSSCMPVLDNFRTKLSRPRSVQLSLQMHYDQFATGVSHHI